MFKKIDINIPFAEALAHMSNYVKFLKDIPSKKRRSGEFNSHLQCSDPEEPTS